MQKRKDMRLEGYDYSQNGAYFITICMENKQCILWDKNVGTNCVRPNLSDIGNIVDKEISMISSHYLNVNIDKYVIMPNHINLLIVIYCEDGGRTQFAPTISRIIKQFKGSITKQIVRSIWQKSFHDRIIRNEQEYLAIWQYIDENPQKWQEDCYYAI